MRMRLDVTSQISELLKSSFIRKHICGIEVHEIRVDENDVDIRIDFAIEDKWAVVVNLQVGLDDDTELSKLLRTQFNIEQAKKKWFELDPNGSQAYNVAQLNRYLAAFGVRLVQGHDVARAGAAALKLYVERIPTEEEEWL